MKREIFILFFAFSLVFGTFPNSDNPITELPLLSRPSTTSYTVNIFHEAPCNSWNAILTSNYIPPALPASGNWNMIILDMMVSEICVIDF